MRRGRGTVGDITAALIRLWHLPMLADYCEDWWNCKRQRNTKVLVGSLSDCHVLRHKFLRGVF